MDTGLTILAILRLNEGSFLSLWQANNPRLGFQIHGKPLRIRVGTRMHIRIQIGGIGTSFGGFFPLVEGVAVEPVVLCVLREPEGFRREIRWEFQLTRVLLRGLLAVGESLAGDFPIHGASCTGRN
jgi:hypothetical protein